jgi:hypothetical protein
MDATTVLHWHRKPITDFVESQVDLIQEQLNLASLGGLVCSSYSEPLVCILIYVIGIFLSDALLSIEAGEVINCQIVN